MGVKLLSKFKPLYQNETRYFVITGGRGSAKSFHVGDFLVKLSYESGHSILFTRYTMVSAHLSVIPEFTEKLDLYNVHNSFDITKQEIINRHSESKIIFKGIKTSAGNQTASLKSLQGITTWVLDEAEELVDENIFDKIDESVRLKSSQNRIIIILNPATKEHWIYKRFYESKGVSEGFNGVKGDTTYIHSTYLDNIDNLSESIIHKFEKLKITSPAKYNHRVLGGWLDKAEGVVIENWKYESFDCSSFDIYGLDYGFYPDPTALVGVKVDKKTMTIYVKEFVYSQKLTTDHLSKRLPSNNSLIICDNSEPRLTSEIIQEGYNLRPVTKFNDSIRAGLDLLTQYNIVVHPDSINLAKELNNYVWNDKKSSTPIDDWNHAIDALRYAMMEYENLKNKTGSQGYKIPKQRRRGDINLSKFI